MMQSYIFGKPGLAATPEELARRRSMAQAMIRSGTEQTPQDPWDGLAAVARAVSGNYADYKLGQQEAANRKATDDRFASLLSDLSGGTVTQAAYSPGLDASRRAFLDAVAGPESGGAYDKLYGGGKFTSYADHPRQNIPIKTGPNAGKTSSAAGKYQFLAPTWDTQRAKLKLPDFSPESQDAAAWDLAASIYNQATGGQLADALAKGDDATLSQVARILSPIWTSLPGGAEQALGDADFVSTFRRNLSAGAKGVQYARAGGVPNLNTLFRAYSDPWARDDQKDILKFYIQQQLQAADPFARGKQHIEDDPVGTGASLSTDKVPGPPSLGSSENEITIDIDGNIVK